MTIVLRCPVRNCSEALSRGNASWECPRGHSFDLARSGYVNLSQPQDKKSRSAGDSVVAVQARRRLHDAGLGDPFGRLLVGIIRESVPPIQRILDAGCGEGFHLGRIAAEVSGDFAGVDLSTRAIELAAKRYPAVMWIVANADRPLPFSASSFDVVLSITARHHAVEFRRLLAADGTLVVAIPGRDDLIELRQAVQGQGLDRDRSEQITALYLPHFELHSTLSFRQRLKLSRPQLLDLLSATYRGARKSQESNVESVGDLDITMSREILLFRPR